MHQLTLSGMKEHQPETLQLRPILQLKYWWNLEEVGAPAS